jgi:hypothetical protein
MGRILYEAGGVLVSSFVFEGKAATSAPAALPSTSAHKGGARFNPILAVVVSVMIMSFFVVGFASGYVRRWIWGYEAETRHTGLALRRSLHATPPKPQRGLDPEVVAAMPRVTFQDLPKDGGKDRDCSVCLAVFDPTDRLKLLPQCAHAFHSACIDEWLRSHSTCPLCRISLALPSKNKSDHPSSNLDRDPSLCIRVPADFDSIPGPESQGIELSLNLSSRGFESSSAGLATIRRSSSVGTNLHGGYEDTHNSHVHDSQGGDAVSSKETGLACSRCSRSCAWRSRRSCPNLRQIEPVGTSGDGSL